MIKARVNGIDCKLFYDERIPLEKAPDGYPYLYHLRHDDCNWIKPVNIEPFVLVNFFGTIFTKRPFKFDKDNFIPVTRFWMEKKFIHFSIRRELLEELMT